MPHLTALDGLFAPRSQREEPCARDHHPMRWTYQTKRRFAVSRRDLDEEPLVFCRKKLTRARLRDDRDGDPPGVRVCCREFSKATCDGTGGIRNAPIDRQKDSEMALPAQYCSHVEGESFVAAQFFREFQKLSARSHRHSS